jgi:NADP-dependent 3-hydroxy acid dehydrogenase YdfG
MLDAADGPIAVIDSTGPVGACVVRRLVEQGYEAALADEVPPRCRAAIFLSGLKRPLTDDEAISANRHAFLAAHAISSNPALFVTVQDTGGDFCPDDTARAWSGGVAGVARTAALEWPAARVKAIDIDTFGREPEQIAEALVKELTTGGAEIDVALNAWGHRVTLAAEPMKAGGGSLALESDAFIIATGGARGVTAACLLDLARKTPIRLLVLGRTTLEPEPKFCAGLSDQPSLNRAFIEDARVRGVSISELAAKTANVLAVREIRANLAAIERTGSQVRYECVDIRDESAVTVIIENARRTWGPVRGLVHGAGVLADKRIQDLTTEQFDAVFSTKVDGLRALLKATAPDPLVFVALFSSIAARCGNPGQAAYAAANEAMNRVAHAESHRRAGLTKVKALNWGPWDGGMVTPSLKRLFEERGVPLLSLEQGARLFTDELFNGMNEEVEVVLGTMPTAAKPALRVVINRDSHPHLDSHRIQDVPIFPMVSALDLFLRATRSERNGGGAFCRNLRVLRGIRLEGYENGGDPLIVRASANGAFEIVSAAGTRHYEASLDHDHAVQNGFFAASLRGLTPAPWSSEELYGSLLFHGPAFRVIESIEGVSDAGIAGMMTGARAKQWTDSGRTCDGAMLDGGLQLARLWGFHTLGRPSLPMSIGTIHILEPEDAAASVRCEVRARVSQPTRFVCDIAWTSSHGRLLATMKEVEMYTVPEAE